MYNNAIQWTWYTFEQLTSMQVYDMLALRQNIFVVEQGCVFQEIDYHDQHALHLFGEKDGHLVAYLRFLPKGTKYPEDASFGRFITRGDYKRIGLGKIMMQHLFEYFDARYPGDSMFITAQQYLQPFYERYGFEPLGDTYDDEGITHILMRRQSAVI